MTRSRTTHPEMGGGDNVVVSPSSAQTGSTDGNFKSAGMQPSPVSNKVDETDPGPKNEGMTVATDGGDETEEETKMVQEPKKIFKLYKSPRFKGYFLILLSSVINFHSIGVSQDTTDVSIVVPSSEQVGYGLTVSLISAIITGIAVLFHLLSWFTCDCFVNRWALKLFAPKAKIELFGDIFLLLWWFLATVIQTGVRGIAGDGKEQYNIYYSTWFCTLAALFCLESKLTEYDWPSIKTFVKSWPNRAPGWIAILVFDFFAVIWYVDLYINTAQNPDRVADSLKPFWGEIPKSQYEWLIFVASVTLLPAAAFIFAEIFRDSSNENSEKPPFETKVEGIVLLLLTIGWIPSVIVATTPGGFASYIGNAYFFTWATTVLVLETTMWFIHDSRGGVHQMILKKEQEYRQHQKDVLEATRKLQLEAAYQRQEEIDDRRDRSETDDVPIFGESPGVPTMTFAGVREEIIPAPEVEGEQGVSDFEMQNISEEDETSDDTIQQERRMREANKRAYFDALDDILE
jgi:hypothetical protein